MKQLLKNEFSRLWSNKILYLVFGIECLIVVIQFFSETFPYRGNGVYQLDFYPLSVFEKWIGGEKGSFYPTLYFMLLPILMAIPYGGTFLQDIRSGYVKHIFTRSGKRAYFLAKYVVSMVSGILGVIPLICNFCITACVLPAVSPQAGEGTFPLVNTSLYSELFYEHPYTYLAVWLVQDMIFLGALATVSLTASFFTDYIYVPILAPFLFCMLMYGLDMVFQAGLSPFDFLNPSQIVEAKIWVMAGEFVLLLLIGGVGFWMCGKRQEVF